MSLISGSDWSFVILLLIVILSALTLMVISCMVRRETTTMAKTTEISNKILQVSIVFIALPPLFAVYMRIFRYMYPLHESQKLRNASHQAKYHQNITKAGDHFNLKLTF